jgi:hypothetical protein
MALNTVSLPFGYYPDPTKGRPVFNGSIFIGEPDLDPTILANQKTITIRQEGVDTPSVPQPISTSAGGVPVFNGSPAEILVDGSYSMAVLNAQDAQVYYVASQNDADSFSDSDSRYGPVFETAAAMTAAGPVSVDGVGVTIVEGNRYHTLGRFVAGDAGYGSYIGNPNQAVDGQGDLLADNGVALILESEDRLRAAQYGMRGEATATVTIDNSDALEAMIAAGNRYEFEADVYYGVSRRIVWPQFLSALGNGAWIVPLAAFTIAFGEASWADVDTNHNGDSGFWTTAGWARTFDINTAAWWHFDNLNIDFDRANVTQPQHTVRLANIAMAKIENCNWTLTSSANINNVTVWLDACCNNMVFDNCHLENSCQDVLDGGGTFWVSAINGYSANEVDFTKNITLRNSKIVQDSNDDTISLFCRQGVIQNVNIYDVEVVSSGVAQAALISIHTVLDFTPTARIDSTAYSLGDFIGLTTANGFFYKCTQAGTSGTDESLLLDPYIGKQITDGTAVFEARTAGVQNATLRDMIIDDDSSNATTIRVGRDLAADAFGSTRNIKIDHNSITYRKSQTQTALIQVDRETTENVTVVNNSLVNAAASGIPNFGIFGADLADNNNITGPFATHIAGGQVATNNTIYFPDGAALAPRIAAVRTAGNQAKSSDGRSAFLFNQANVPTLESIFNSNFGSAVNLVGNSNSFSAGGWAGTGSLTTFTPNFSDDVYGKMSASRMVNATGGTVGVNYTTGNQADGEHTGYVSIKNNNAGEAFVDIVMSSVANAGNAVAARHYIYDDRWTVVPVTYTKATSGSDAIKINLGILDGSDILVAHAQINSGEAGEYAWTSGGNAAAKGVVVFMTAAPTTGTWQRGDIQYNLFPVAGGTVGNVCVLDGTPGTWKTFGVIAA